MSNRTHQAGYRALRRGRYSVSGQLYLVTAICDSRRLRFRKKDSATAVASKLREPDLWRDTKPLCWILMPDHIHLLIQLGSSESLSALVRRVKCITALAVNRHERLSGRLWMPGFHDHALRRDEDIAEVARYILANPIRASLVSNLAHYPYWHSALGV